MTHSPLPWKAGASDEDAELIYDAEDDIVASVEDISKFSRSSETVARENANAALIVQSVNCHDALLTACIESRKLGMKIYHNANAHEAPMDWAAVKALLDASIAKAEGRA